MDINKDVAAALGLVSIGAAIGIGQLLSSNDPITTRVAAGRAIVSGGLGLAAAAVLAFLPDLNLYVQMGIAASLASLGTSGVELVVRKYTGQS